MSRLTDAEIEALGMARKLFEMNFDFPKHMEEDINLLLKGYDALLCEVAALKAELAEARSRLMHVSLHPHKPYSKCTCGAWNDPGSCGHHPSCPLKATEG